MNPIKLISQTRTRTDFGTAPTNWDLWNIGEKLRIETIFEVSVYTLASSDNVIILNATDGYVGAGWAVGSDGAFKDFKVGDSVNFGNYVTSTVLQTFTILEKIGDYAIQVDAAFTSYANDYDSEQTYFSLTDPITAIKYHFNFIENNAAENFLSKADGSEQMMLIPSKLASDTAPSALLFTGSQMWRYGSATIEGVSITATPIYKSRYKIVHDLTVPSFIFNEQLENELSGIPPEDFFTVNNCWKFIAQIEATQLSTDPNFLVSEIFQTTIGNTGWYGENFNTGESDYSVGSVVYKNSAGAVIDSIALNDDEGTVVITLNNSTDTPFSNNNTEFVLGIEKVPSDPSEYQTNGTLEDNFLFDRAKQTVGSAAVNGDQYGVASRQILKDVHGTFVSTSQITIECTIAMLSDVIAKFAESATPRYLLFVSIQNHTLDTTSAILDAVTLKVDLNEFTLVTADTGMIVFDTTKFIRHPEADPETEGLEYRRAYIIYDASSWTGGSALFNLTAALSFLIAGTNSYTVTIQSTIDGAMAALAAKINLAAGETLASWNSGTEEFTIIKPGPLGNGDTIIFSAAGPGAPTIVDPTGTLGDGVDIDILPQDELVPCTKFYIESSTRLTDEIKLTSVKGQIIASDGTDEFKLDEFILSLTGVELTGYTQQFDFQAARQFNVNADSIRKFVQVKRRNDLDTGTRKYFSSNYALMWRWETWTKLLGVNSDFFDSSLPNNGFNHWWYRYAQVGSWELYYKITVNATKNGTPQTYSTSIPVFPHDYESNADYVEKDVLCFNADDLADLLSGSGGAQQLQTGGTSIVTINGQDYYTDGVNVAFRNKKTLIVAIFEKSTTPAGVYVEIKAEVFEKGGTSGERIYSSKWASDGNTWFSSTDGSDKVVVYAYGDSIVAMCYFDPDAQPSSFPSAEKFISFTARIYEIGGTLATDDGVTIQTDDGIDIVIS